MSSVTHLRAASSRYMYMCCSCIFQPVFSKYPCYSSQMFCLLSGDVKFSGKFSFPSLCFLRGLLFANIFPWLQKINQAGRTVKMRLVLFSLESGGTV